MKHPIKLSLLILLFTCAATLPALAQKKPNLSGVWRRTLGQELMTIEHRDPKIHLVYWINDPSGERTLDLTAMTDGKEYKQTAMGQPATVVMRWEGAGLLWEFQREAGTVKIHNRRTFKLAADGQSITAERMDFNADGTARSPFTEKLPNGVTGDGRRRPTPEPGASNAVLRSIGRATDVRIGCVRGGSTTWRSRRCCFSSPGSR